MKSNHLINESSPYLQQHAYNPVEWYPWSDETLDRAIDEDKPIILSIGYSTCHWCHVMERESFEDEGIAAFMNENYICIKVDREERPDVDQIYMDALNIMGIQGGWPLNVFLTPDRKPFYGGTYFPAEGWTGLLENITKAFAERRPELVESAQKFTEALEVDSIMKYSAGDSAGFDISVIKDLYKVLSNSFDKKNGGTTGAPKFPMPAIWEYLNLYVNYSANDGAAKQLGLTLDKMALGGIYDHVGGGFSRYSTDDKWFAPHFEKMLYDNGQLLSLYSKAYTHNNSALYKRVVFETIDWMEREMSNEKGAFYAALDADSEGVEGKFYVWSQDQLESLLGAESELISKYYNTTSEGNWEDGANILHQEADDIVFCKNNDIELSDLGKKILDTKAMLLKERETRVRPGLDTKVLLGWNALASRGLIDSYITFGEQKFLELAQKNVDFLLSEMSEENALYHVHGKKIPGFLDDYALCIETLIYLYQVTLQESYLEKAKTFVEYTLQNFYDKNNYFFFYTSRKGEKLIADRKELFDNVIPSSNSTMAGNLFDLGVLLEDPEYLNIARLMVRKVSGLIKKEPRYLAKWAQVYHNMLMRPAEVAVVGPNAKDIVREIICASKYDILTSATTSASNLPMLDNRIAIDDKTTIYVCKDKTCQLPVHSVEDALGQIEKIQE